MSHDVMSHDGSCDNFRILFVILKNIQKILKIHGNFNRRSNHPLWEIQRDGHPQLAGEWLFMKTVCLKMVAHEFELGKSRRFNWPIYGKLSHKNSPWYALWSCFSWTLRFCENRNDHESNRNYFIWNFPVLPIICCHFYLVFLRMPGIFKG